MKLYIKVQDGNPVEHPILEDNFKQAFPDIDTENLPDNFAPFERVTPPTLSVYQVQDSINYELIDGVYKDVYVVRNMTEDEKTTKQNIVKKQWKEGVNWSSWSFDEATCSYTPPVDRPSLNHIWNEETLSWVERN